MDAPQWNCPFIRVSVLLLCASLDLFGVFAHRSAAEHRKVFFFYCGQTPASLSPSVPPSRSLLISQRYARSSKSCGIIFELYKGVPTN